MAVKDKNADVLDLIAYGLSKFAGMTKGHNEFTEYLGYSSMSKFLNYLVEIGLVSSNRAMSNRQDGFDAVFENAKVGWKDAEKVKKYTNLRGKIDSVIGIYGMEEYAVFVKQLISFVSFPEQLGNEVTANIQRVISTVYSDSNQSPAILNPAVAPDANTNEIVDSVEQIDTDNSHEERLHTEAQWLLIQLGKMTGCQVFIAKNDSKCTYHQVPLCDGCLSDLPRIGLEDKTYKRASLIDIVWIYKRKIVCAFEVEVSTSIYSGILRMSDLAYSMPYDAIEGYIVAPNNRINKVIEQLQRPTFSNDLIHNRIKYTSVEEIRDLYAKIKDMNAPQGAITWEILHGCSHSATE